MTPAMALRLGVLAAIVLFAFAVLFFRLWALQVLAGDQRSRRRAGQPAPHRPDRRGARADPRLQGPAARLEPDRHRRAGLDGVHAGPRPAADAAPALGDPDGPGAGAPAPAARAQGRSLTPVTLKEDLSQEEIFYLKEHRRDFPASS